MRIAYLSGSQIPSQLANSVHVMKMCAALARQGHDVDLYARPGEDHGPSPFDLYGVDPTFRIIHCRRPPVRYLGGLLYSRNVKHRLLKEEAYDLIYARHAYSAFACRKVGVPLIYEAHVAPTGRIQRWVEIGLFSQAHFRRLITISSALANYYREHFDELAPDRILVAHDGADAARTGSTNEACRSRIRVGYMGHLYPGKGMEVISKLPALLTDMDFIIVGGTARDVRHWRRLVEQENVQFMGHVPHRDIPGLIASCDVLLAPYQRRVSVKGGRGDISQWMSPLKLFEYMAHGKAIVCSDLPVLREILENDITGVLVDPENIQGWVNAIRQLANNPNDRLRLGENARQRFQRNFSWDARALATVGPG